MRDHQSNSQFVQARQCTRHRVGCHLGINMYTEGQNAKDVKKLPLNLLDALRALDKSSVIREAFGEKSVASYLKLKHDDWNAYSQHLTEWERQTTLDC